MHPSLGRLRRSLPRLRGRAGAAPAAIPVTLGLAAATLAGLHVMLAGRAWADPELVSPGADHAPGLALGLLLDRSALLGWAQLLGLPAVLDATVNLALLAGIAAVLFMSWRTQRLA